MAARRKRISGGNALTLRRVQDSEKLIAARVAEVVSGNVPSFFIHGPGGHGKSHAVTEELNRAPGHDKWWHFNNHITTRALVDQLNRSADGIYLFEDMEDIFQEKRSAGILRSACASVRGQPRRITYTTKNDEIDFVFEGGIIVISNEPMTDNGILGAVASRMRPMEWRLQPAAIAAIMLEDAAKGHSLRGHHISPSECLEVAEFVIGEMRSGKVDLRTYFDHALPSYLHWKQQKSPAVHWRDVLKSKIVGQPVIEKRRERVTREQTIACECFFSGGSTQERVALWRERTGWGKQAFYNRLRDARVKGIFMDQVAAA